MPLPPVAYATALHKGASSTLSGETKTGPWADAFVGMVPSAALEDQEHVYPFE